MIISSRTNGDGDVSHLFLSFATKVLADKTCLMKPKILEFVTPKEACYWPTAPQAVYIVVFFFFNLFC